MRVHVKAIPAECRWPLGAVLLLVTLLSERTVAQQSATPDVFLPTPELGFTDSRTDRNARRAYEDARSAFTHGDGTLALRGFQRARELSALPELLYFIGRSHELLGDRDHARQAYEELLTGFSDETLRTDAETRLNRLLGTGTPTVVAATLAPPPAGTVQTQATLLRPLQTTPVTPSDVPSVLETWWFWTAVGVVVATGVGVGIGVYAADHPSISEPPVAGNITGQGVQTF